MTPLAANPFTVLTLIAGPAVLTNASSVLALGTSNRFARAIDRARALSKLLEDKAVNGDPLTLMRVQQLNRTERRAVLMLHALRAFYLALGSFAAASLVSLIGASVAASEHTLVYRSTLLLALVTGVIGVGGLVVGCALLVTDTRLALLNVSEEARLVRARYKDYLTVSQNAGGPE